MYKNHLEHGEPQVLGALVGENGENFAEFEKVALGKAGPEVPGARRQETVRLVVEVANCCSDDLVGLATECRSDAPERQTL